MPKGSNVLGWDAPLFLCVPLTVDSVSQNHPCFEKYFEILMEADTPFTAFVNYSLS